MAALAALLLANCAGKRVETLPYADGYRPAPGTAVIVPVKAGEEIAAIAKRFGVQREDIIAMNNLHNNDRTVAKNRIYLPAYAARNARAVAAETLATAQQSRATAATRIAVRPLDDTDSVPVPMRKPGRTVAQSSEGGFASALKGYLNRGQEEARPVPEGSGSFIWPVNGRVLSKFGGTDTNGRNDGINIAVPHGTPIRAAADGTVSYVGNELKAFGNLLLIKHDDGFVTAYAHADRFAVERGEKVRRGDIVGYTGSSGDVSEPQLHFEIRKGTKPVNPTAYLGATRNQASLLPSDPARS
jgi:murein DD-endopeptidase MepM/ murein hydrolase activator NlpD